LDANILIGRENLCWRKLVPAQEAENPFPVIPAKAGIQEEQRILDPGDPVPAKAGSRGDA